MKIVLIEFPDDKDLTTVIPDFVVSEETATVLVGGMVIHVGQHSNPSDPTVLPHNHPYSGATGGPSSS